MSGGRDPPPLVEEEEEYDLDAAQYVLDEQTGKLVVDPDGTGSEINSNAMVDAVLLGRCFR
eukprot:4625042-Prymnesium_polylepis.3